MIYLASAFSDVLTLIATLLLVNTIINVYNNKLRMIYAVTICSALSLIMTFCYMQETNLYDGIALLCYTTRYLAVLLIVYGRLKWEYIYTIILYEFVINILVSSITNLLENIIEIQFRLLSTITAITINIIAILLINIFNAQIKFAFKHIKGIIPRYLYILVLLAVICLCGLSTLNNYSTENTAAKENIMNLIIVVFTFIIGYIIISLLINVISKQHFRSTTAMLQNQVEIQIRHYDKMK